MQGSFLNFLGRARGSSIRYGCFPALGNEMSVLIEWTPSSTLENLFKKYSPIEVKCSKYHDTNGKVVLVGDVAHTMLNALNQ